MTQPTITVEPCTNYEHTRRHYSINLTTNRYNRGREGTSLCRTGGNHTGVYDDAAINAELRKWKPDRPLIVVADLPECKACLRIVAKLETANA